MTVCLPINFDALVALSPDERHAVEELIAQCKAADGFDPCLHFDTHLNADHGLPAWRLAWAESAAMAKGGRILAGAACAFAPCRKEGEISACVSPVFRRQGIFKELYDGLAESLLRSGAESIMLVCESASPSGVSIAEHLGGVLDHGEYLMTLPPERSRAVRPPDGIRLVPVSIAFIAEVISLSGAIFGDSPEDARSFTVALLEDGDREQFIARTGDGAVGMVALSREDDAFAIHGLGVRPDFRRRGLGGAILDACLVVLSKRGVKKIMLEVDADNPAALALYQSRGFVMTSRADYWKIPGDGKSAG